MLEKKVKTDPKVRYKTIFAIMYCYSFSHCYSVTFSGLILDAGLAGVSCRDLASMVCTGVQLMGIMIHE
jgi:hypothetical protein